jgi:hypothetical protein
VPTTLVTNVGELSTLAGGVRYGSAMNDLAIVRDAGVVIVDGVFHEIGPSEKIARKWRAEADEIGRAHV